MQDKNERHEHDEEIADIGAASELTQAIGNTNVEPNGEPLFYK